MKKIVNYLIASAILCAAISCQKEPQAPVGPEIPDAPETPETPEVVTTIIKAGFDDTKTALQSDYKVFWTDGDAICVNGVSSEAVSLSEPSASAEFTFNAVISDEKKAVYPASAWASDGTITLPATQDAGTNASFASGALPLVAYAASGNELSFKHIGAVVKLQLKKGATSDNIDYVEFSGNNGEQVSGIFSIDYTTGALTPTSTADADKTVRVSVGKALGSDATAVYIAVPAMSFSSGFKMKVIDVNGVTMTKRVGAANLKKGGIYPTPIDTFDADNTIKAFAKSYVNILKVWESHIGRVNNLSIWDLTTDGGVEDAHYIPKTTTITVGEKVYSIGDMFETALRSYLRLRGYDGSDTEKYGYTGSTPKISSITPVSMSEAEVTPTHGYYFSTPLIESTNLGYLYRKDGSNKVYHEADVRLLDNWANRSINYNHGKPITNLCNYDNNAIAPNFYGTFSSGRALITYAFFFKYMLDNDLDRADGIASSQIIRSELFGKEGNY